MSIRLSPELRYIIGEFELSAMEKLSVLNLVKLLKNRDITLNMEEAHFATEFINCIVDLSSKLEYQNLLLKPTLDFEEASRYLRLSQSHLYKLTSLRQVPHYCPQGKKLYFNREELDKWLLRNRRITKEEIDIAATDYVIRNKRRK